MDLQLRKPHIKSYLLVSVTDERISLLFDNFQKKSENHCVLIDMAAKMLVRLMKHQDAEMFLKKNGSAVARAPY